MHRAPVAAVVGNARQARPYAAWPPIGLRGVALTASGPAEAVVPNVDRPGGIRVTNCLPHATVTAFDYGDPTAGLRPIVVAAAINGVFSGRLLVDSNQPIKGLKASVSDLSRAGGGAIPASAVQVRYAEPAVPAKSWLPALRFDGLLDAIPAEVPLVKAAHWPIPDGQTEFAISEDVPAAGRRGLIADIHAETAIADDRKLSNGAAAPLWLTVRVPKATTPGRYEGTVTVSAEGLPPTAVPLLVNVHGWSVPDPKDFRIQNFAYHSTDAVAKHYGVPLWSDRHFALMAQSLALMAHVNSRQAIVNLAIDFYGANPGGNEESMVRWVKQPDGSFKHDFAILDKYLDLVAKTYGKPSLLRVNCWGEVWHKDGKLLPGWPGLVGGKPLAVTVLDPATGKIDRMEQPCPGTEESFTFFKPVLDEVRRKVEARGWWDVTAMGHHSYSAPPAPEVVSVYKRIWPDGVWSYTAHDGVMGAVFKGVEPGVTMPVRYADTVWNHGKITSRGYVALLLDREKPRPSIWCFTWRRMMRDASNLTVLRAVLEDEIMRGQDGLSDFGADLFPLKDARGRFYCLPNGRGTGGPGESTRAMFAPGPDGPIATERYEMLREGLQLAEAILFIQRAIDGKKLPADLTLRANRYLDERGKTTINCRQYFSQRWVADQFEQDEKLLALAAEVAAALAAK